MLGVSSGGGGPESEFGALYIRIGDRLLTTFLQARFTQHFLTPTDSFSFELGSDLLDDELLDELLIPGNKVEIFIDDAKQFTGYIDVVDTSNLGRHEGSSVTVEGRDTMSPVCDSQIDPEHHYPDKTPLDKLLRDVLEPWFPKFDITNEANIEVAAGKAAKAKLRKRKRKSKGRALSAYPIPKSKPDHNDSFFQFLSRITQRYGLWIWPSVDGDTVIVGKPNFDQEPIAELRRKRQAATSGFGRSGGANLATGPNNIVRGGIRRDASEQPSMIVARGSVPPKAVQHARTRVIIGNPYDDVVARILGVDSSPKNVTPAGGFNVTTGKEVDDTVFRILKAADVISDKSASERGTRSGLDESGTLNSFQDRRQVVHFNETTYIPVKPIEVRNTVFASKVARPRFLKDRHSRTIEELEHFARRQMSLCTRKAFVPTYQIAGFKVDGVIPVVDSVLSVDDDLSRFQGLLWVLAREVSISRGSGPTMTITFSPLNSIQF